MCVQGQEIQITTIALCEANVSIEESIQVWSGQL